MKRRPSADRVGGGMCSPYGRRVDSAHGRRPQQAGADGRPETTDRTHHAEHVAYAKQPCHKREGHGGNHHQQRKMGDELKLLGRMVLRCGAVGSAGEGVRVNETKPSTRWACGKSVTQLQYPAKSISSNAAHVFRQYPNIASNLMRQRYKELAKKRQNLDK